MKGFVFAAGFGSRLEPLTKTVPKPMMPVGNVPLIGYALKLLAHHGIREVVVNLHHLGRTLKEQLGTGEQFGVSITYSEEEEILGTGGGLKKMHDHLGDEAFVVLNGDTVMDVDLSAAIDFHRQQGAMATMVLREDPRQAEFGQIEIDHNHRIRRMLGHGGSYKLDPEAPLRAFMFAGVHILEPRFLEYIPPDVNTCINRYAYMKAINNDEPLAGFVMDGYWADAGTPERYYQTNVDALDQRMPLRHVDPLGGFAVEPKKQVAEVVRMGDQVDLGNNVRINPPVILGDQVKVGDNTSLGPYAVIGARASIGKDAHVSNAVILEGAKVESGSTAHRVLMGKKACIDLDHK